MADFGLSPDEFEIVSRILARYVPDRPVFVFGSRATGQAKRRSDLDIAVGGNEPLSLRIQGDLADAFDESDLPIEVDVVDLASVSETFRKRISAEWAEFTPLRQEVHA
jgi:predicted nucleotidyltransferase